MDNKKNINRDSIQFYFWNGEFMQMTTKQAQKEFDKFKNKFLIVNNLENIKKLKKSNILIINEKKFFYIKMHPDYKNPNHRKNIENSKKDAIVTMSKKKIIENEIDYIIIYYDAGDEIISFLISSSYILKFDTKDEVKIFIDLNEFVKVYFNENNKINLRKRGRTKDGDWKLETNAIKSNDLFNHLMKISENENSNMEIDDETILSENEKEYLVKIRLTQKKLRIDSINKQESLGEYVKIAFKPTLVASHIIPWSKSNEKQKIDLDNVILLDALTDKLFDGGYISFDDEGQLLKSKSLIRELKNDVELNLFISKGEKIEMNEKRKEYMEYHRKNIFSKRNI